MRGGTKSCGCLAREVARARLVVCEMSELDRESNKKRYVNTLNIAWRKKVLDRDGHVCQACGAKGYVVAHHKNSWASYPEGRLDVGNGSTACYGCHLDFHSIYGQGRNTEQQWNDFCNSRTKTDGTTWCKKRYSVAVGEKHGRLLVLERVENRGNGTWWKCRCDCGNKHVVAGGALKSGNVKSCGCLRLERLREAIRMRHENTPLGTIQRRPRLRKISGVWVRT